MSSKSKTKSLEAKKAALAVKLLSAVMTGLTDDSIQLTEEYWHSNGYRKRTRKEVRVYLPGTLMSEIDKLIEAQPALEIKVKVSARDAGKIKKNTENSCMTEATKKSILAALKAKGVK